MVSNTLEQHARVLTPAPYGTDAMAEDPMLKWNVAAPKSIAKPIDVMAKNQGYGEKQNITTAAMAIFLLMGERMQRAWLRELAMATASSEYGTKTVLEELRDRVMGNKTAAWPNPDGSMTYLPRQAPDAEPKPLTPDELKAEADKQVNRVQGTTGKTQPKPSREGRHSA